VLRNNLNEANLDDPKFLEAVKFLRSLVYENAVSPDPANTDPNAVFQLFAAGKIAMTGGGHWPMQFFASNNFKDFDVLPWPKKASKSTVFGVDGWGISPKTKNPELAWELLKDLASVESQRQAAGSGVANPARRSVAKSEEFQVYRNMFFFGAAAIALNVSLGLFLAILVNQTLPAFMRYLLRTVYFFPVLVGMIYAATVWKFLFNRDLVSSTTTYIMSESLRSAG
jgi:ABC-type glycerol-3-phosphate transport system substrate-binding protein